MKDAVTAASDTATAAEAKTTLAGVAVVQEPLIDSHVANNIDPVELGNFLANNGIVIGGDLFSLSQMIALTGCLYMLKQLGGFTLIKTMWNGAVKAIVWIKDKIKKQPNPR